MIFHSHLSFACPFLVVYRSILHHSFRSTMINISVFVFYITDFVYGVYGWCIVAPNHTPVLFFVFQLFIANWCMGVWLYTNFFRKCNFSNILDICSIIFCLSVNFTGSFIWVILKIKGQFHLHQFWLFNQFGLHPVLFIPCVQDE